MLRSRTNPESYITEYASVYEDKPVVGSAVLASVGHGQDEPIAKIDDAGTTGVPRS